MAKVQIVTTEAFRRERWWFALGLAGLTLVVLLPFAIAEAIKPVFSEIFWLFVAPSGALGMGVAGFAAYSLTTQFKAPLASGRVWDVVIHLIVVPLISFPIAGFAFGLLTLTDERRSEFLWVTVYAILFGVMLLGIPCLVVTAVWSVFFLYVIRPKYAVVEEHDRVIG